MKDKTPNQIINKASKELKQLNKDCKGFADHYDYEQEKKILEQLRKEIKVTGFPEMLSKKGIIQLITIQRKFNLFSHTGFYLLFDF